MAFLRPFFKVDFRQHEPEVLKRTARVVDVHAFLVHHLTGEWRTTSACADPLGLVDMSTFDWSDEVLSLVGLERDQLCELAAPGAVMGELRSDVAEELGVPAQIPHRGRRRGWTVGRSRRQRDQTGTGIPQPRHRRRIWDLQRRVRLGREFRTMGGPIPETYTLETLLQGGTYTVSWFVSKLAGTEASRLGLDLSDEDVLETAAARLSPGADGLLAVPYWNQSQTPTGTTTPGA